MAEGPRRRVWWVAFLVFTGMGAVWSWSVAPVGGPDERAHIVKAVAVASGDLSMRSTVEGTNGVTVPIATYTVPRAYDNPGIDCFIQQPQLPTSCAPPLRDDETPAQAVTYVGAYSPLYYAAVGWPSQLLPPSTAVYAMRAAGAVISGALLASALVSLLALRVGPIVIAGLALALTPTVAYLTGVVNPNGVEIAAAVAFWSALLLVVAAVTAVDPGGPSRSGHPPPIPARVLARLVIAGTLLAFTRPMSPAFVVAIVVIVLLASGGRSAGIALWANRRLRWCFGGLAVAVVASAGLSVAFQSYEVIGFPYNGPAEGLGLVEISLRLTDDRVTQMVGSLESIGLVSAALSSSFVNIWLVATLALVVAALIVGRTSERVIIALLTLGLLVLPVVADVLAARRYGYGWQGRYALPLASGLPILASVIVGRSARVSLSWSRAAACVVVIGVATVQLIAYLTLVARNLVGHPFELADAFADAAWSGPATPEVVLAAAAAVLVGFVAGGLRLALGPDP